MPVPESDDAHTHGDLATAYAEMGLQRDALHESALAIAGNAELAAQHGSRVLRGLTDQGWNLLRALPRLN